MLEPAGGFQDDLIIALNADNQEVIKLAQNNVSKKCTKHMNIKYHIIRNDMAEKKLHLNYCPSNDVTADFSTKPLSKDLFQQCSSKTSNEK